MCELTEKHEPIAEEARAKVIGVGRDAENDKALVVYFDKPPSDGGLRGLHEMLRAKDELDRIRKGLRLIGYVPVDELSRLESGHMAMMRSAKFGPSELDGDVPVYVTPNNQHEARR